MAYAAVMMMIYPRMWTFTAQNDIRAKLQWFHRATGATELHHRNNQPTNESSDPAHESHRQYRQRYQIMIVVASRKAVRARITSWFTQKISIFV
jgi:hypothetical protein